MKGSMRKNVAIKIPHTNNVFYNEALRAKSIDEINNSSGLKSLAYIEIEVAKRQLLESYYKDIEIKIIEDRTGFLILASL